MARELTSRFAGRIRWIGFQNQSGQDIPPYSIIEASGWQMPDPGGSDISVTSPIILADQSEDPINPYACYITGAGMTPAGGQGVCARPTLDLPLLVSVSGSQQDGDDAPFRMCGPSDGSWEATRDMPGFAMVDLPQQGYALVSLTLGPYRGNLPQNASITTGSVQVTPLVEPFDETQAPATPSKVTVTCYNPYGNIDTTQRSAIIRCTFDWVCGNWELIDNIPSSAMIRGVLQGNLAQGGSVKITTAGGLTETVHEVLGTSGMTISAGTNVTAFYNAETKQYEVVSTGCMPAAN